MLTAGTYSGIRSIQRGEITLAGGTNIQTATITAVNPQKTFLTLLGQEIAGYTSSNVMCRLSLTNATTLTLARGPAVSGDCKVSYEVVEWY